MKKLLIIPLLALSLYSCNNEDEREIRCDQQSQSQSLGFSVKALYSQNHRISVKDAEGQLKDILNGSNNGLKRAAGKAIKQAYVVVRKNRLKSSYGDTLAYVFNFADKGFAICSADDRTPENVLAIIDNGSYEDGEELRNPNYAFISNKIENYINYSINDFETNKEKYLSIVNSLGGAQSCQLKAATTTTVIGEQAPLLQAEWSQYNPYNSAIGKKCGKNGCNRKAVVGCGALALAQVLDYWQLPDEYDWDSLDANPNELYRFIADISDEINNSWGCGENGHPGSSTGETKIEQYLKDYRIKYKYFYKSADLTYENIKSLLNQKCPLIINAVANVNNVNCGHSWVIDGYLHFQLKYISIIRLNYSLVHFNWGWGGYCNGYFSYNVFCPANGTIYDNSNHNDAYKDYDFNLISSIIAIQPYGENQERLFVGSDSDSDETIDTYEHFDKCNIRGLLGCVYKDYVNGTYAFCRYKHNSTGKYVYCIEKGKNADGTMKLKNCSSFSSNGYTLVKRLGYVYDNVGDGRTPICEYRNKSDNSYHGVSYAYDKYILSKNTYMLDYFAALCRVKY